MIAVEEDGDDVGYSLLSDGCLRCAEWNSEGTKRVGIPLVERAQGGGVFWCCPKCGCSYGAV